MADRSNLSEGGAKGETSGAPSEFSKVHEEFREPIQQYLLRLTRNPAEADDLAQEVFLKVHGGLAAFRGDASLKTWIYRIASNAFIDRGRGAAKRIEKATRDLEAIPGGDWEDEESLRPEEESIEKEQSACIHDYVDRLPPSYRAVIVMHDMEGLTNPEIADVLGCSLATAKIRLHRAREKMKAAMDQGCDLSVSDRGKVVCDPKKKDEPRPGGPD